MKPKRKQDGETSVAMATLWFVLFWVLVLLVAGGMATGLGYTPRRPLIGWALFIAGLISAVVTVDRWARTLPGVFAVATMNGVMILITGHALNQPDVLVPRAVGILLTILMGGGAIITSNSSRPLEMAAQLAYLGIFLCFAALLMCIMIEAYGWEIPVLIGFVTCLTGLLITRLKPMSS